MTQRKIRTKRSGTNLRSNERGSAALYLIFGIVVMVFLIVLLLVLGVLGILGGLAIAGGIALAIFGPKPYSWLGGTVLAILGLVLAVMAYTSTAGGLGL